MLSKNLRGRLKESVRVKILILLVAVFLIVIMFPKGESIETEVTIGSIWLQDDLIAPFSFPINKSPDVYRMELQRAEETVYPVFIREMNTGSAVLDSLNTYNEFLIITLDNDLVDDSSDLVRATFLTPASYRTFKNIRSQEINLIGTKKLSFTELFKKFNEIISSVMSFGILSKNYFEIDKDSIAIRTGNIDRIEPKTSYLEFNDTKRLINEEVIKRFSDEEIQKAISEYLAHFIQPTIVFSSELTNEEIEQAKNRVARNIGIVNENERIIAKHERVTFDAKLKIDSYREAKAERIGEEGLFLQSVGKFLHILFLLSLLSIYIYLFRKKVYWDNLKLILIVFLVLFISFITFLVSQINVAVPIELLIFLPAVSMLITIIFDSRLGFNTTIIMALIVGALRGNDYTFAAMNLFAGALAVYTVRDVKNRSQIFRSFFFILLGYTTAILAFGLERFETAEVMGIEFAFAASNALISPALTFGLLIFFERIFKITTDLTLLELSDFDRPLLRELARKAPGSFTHSMTMGTLAESAAEVIRANPLLARVGAYYHDIGKTIAPINFVENQLNNENRHEKIPPEESARMIIDHVNEGIELAKSNKLPKEIIDFIPMHHGTTLVSFFYEKAKKLYGDDKVIEKDYRYPGPKPNTKETAIVMLADACESAVRSISDPDPTKVENIISRLIKSRVDDGQLDESPITFNELRKIKESFLVILLGQHHRRIRYPKQDEMESGKDSEDER